MLLQGMASIYSSALFLRPGTSTQLGTTLGPDVDVRASESNKDAWPDLCGRVDISLPRCLLRAPVTGVAQLGRVQLTERIVHAYVDQMTAKHRISKEKHSNIPC